MIFIEKGKYMGILGVVGQMMRKKHAKTFDIASHQPRQAQWQKLKTILKQNSQTEYGRKFNFEKIDSILDFQTQVPIVKHSDLKPWLDRMIEHGERNILTFQEPLFYGMTTGSSTGVPKLTPITPAYRDEYQSVVHTFLYHVYKDHPKAFNGKVLYFSGCAEKGRTPGGIACGTMSGFNFVSLPNMVKKFYAVPYEITVIDDNWTRLYITALLALQQNITMMIGITGAPLIAFVKTLQSEAFNLVSDLRIGSLHPDLKLTDKERKLVLSMHKPNASMADKLEKLLNQEAPIAPKTVWPGLELLICWKSSYAGGFIKELESVFNHEVPVRDAIYSATEGWANIPYRDDLIGGPLALNAHFYEFLAEDDDENKQVLLADELEVGKRYRILFTTSSGIYRYDIGDVLEVVEMYHQTPCVKFVRKLGQFCNMVGELMTEFHITEAVTKTADKFDIIIPFYTLMPEQDTFPHYYSLLIELPQDSSEVEYKKIRQSIEDELKIVNIDYKASRNAEELGALVLKRLPENSLSVFRQQQIKLGADEAQIKPIVLALDNSRFSDLEILEVIKE